MCNMFFENLYAKAQPFIKRVTHVFEMARGYHLYLILGLVVVISTKIIIVDQKSELLPTLWISAIAAGLSFNSYVYAKEKFRLDLLDKRWEIYEETLEFCSAVMRHGTLRVTEENEEKIFAAIKAAENSFRGIGYHKTKSLFGEDINQRFEELNKSYSWLSSFTDYPINPDEHQKWVEDKHNHIMFVYKTGQELPEIFKPYVYFGDYRRENTRTS